MVSHPAMKYHMTTEARQKTIRHLRLAHARYMKHFDAYRKIGKASEANYWLGRASDAHQRLLDIGEVAI